MFSDRLWLVAILGPPGGHFGFLRFSQKKGSNKETYFTKVDRMVK